MRGEQEVERAHFVVARTALADAKVAGLRQLAVSGVAESVADEVEKGVVAANAGVILRQPVLIAREVAELETAGLVVEHLQPSREDSASAADVLYARPAKDGKSVELGARAPRGAGVGGITAGDCERTAGA